jgi:hypothetical protein
MDTVTPTKTIATLIAHVEYLSASPSNASLRSLSNS